MIEFNPINPGIYLNRCVHLLNLNSHTDLVRDHLKTLGDRVRGATPGYEATRTWCETRLSSSNLPEKVVARYLLHGCDDKSKVFPFKIVEKGGSRVTAKRYAPHAQSRVAVETVDQRAFVINIPVVYSGDVQTKRQITYLVNLIRDQSFGHSPEESQRVVSNRVVVVIGVNRFKSLDKAKNRALKEFIRDLEAYESLKVDIVGFLWEPKWSRKAFPSVRKVRPYYSMLKRLDPELAEECRLMCENPGGDVVRKRVPYTWIRQALKEWHLADHVQMFRSVNRTREVYLSLMDKDTVQLRSEDGLFSHYDRLIDRFSPEVASTGYAVPEDRSTVLWHIVELDRRVRKAMGCVAYFPEPNMVVKIPVGCETLSESFVKGPAKSLTLESRRLINDVIESRALDPEESIVMDFVGPLVTQTPERFYTKPNRRRVDNRNIGQKSVLSSMHHSKQQSHAPPRSWGEQMGSWLSIHAKKTQILLGNIFKIYDPKTISLDRVFQPTTRLYDKGIHFQSMIESYPAYLALMDRVFAFLEAHEDAAYASFSAHEDVLAFITENDDVGLALEQQMESFFTNYKKLRDAGVSAETLRFVVRKARASGVAIHSYFKELLA